MPKDIETWTLLAAVAQLAGRIARAFPVTTTGFLFTTGLMLSVVLMAGSPLDRRPLVFATSMTLASAFLAGLLL